MTTFADRIISFCNDLDFTGSLPEGISVMNPFRNDPEVSSAVSRFYRKYYCDNKPRHMIIGINPGRFGAGATGIPFTDTIRLEEICGIKIKGLRTRETSSVFIYKMIDQYGGPERFYRDFFITAVSPLGFTARSKTGKEVNYNYYDSKELTEAVSVFIVESLKKQMEFGIENDVCFCLGTGKNYSFLSKLNDEFRFFGRIEPLEHPRFIMQYRAKKQQYYIDLYLQKLINC
jgi:hypothetical protein